MSYQMRISDQAVDQTLDLLPEGQEALKELEVAFLRRQLVETEERLRRFEQQAGESRTGNLPRGSAELAQVYTQRKLLIQALQREAEGRPLLAAIRERLTWAYRHVWDLHILRRSRPARLARWQVQAERDMLTGLLQDWQVWLESQSEDKEL